MREKPVILSRREIAATRLFRIEELELRYADGSLARFERLTGKSEASVMMIPVLGDKVLLVREYAAAIDRYQLGLPTGLVEPGETPEAAAGREMKEEIGYGARQLSVIGELRLVPGYIDHTTHLVLARQLYPQKLPGDELEPPEIMPWPLAELGQLIKEPGCNEARTIAALCLTRELLAHELD